LNKGEAWGDRSEALELLLGAGEAQARLCDAVEGQELQATTAIPLWIICFTESE
jgi:hypothetical protein